MIQWVSYFVSSSLHISIHDLLPFPKEPRSTRYRLAPDDAFSVLQDARETEKWICNKFRWEASKFIELCEGEKAKLALSHEMVQPLMQGLNLIERK